MVNWLSCTASESFVYVWLHHNDDGCLVDSNRACHRCDGGFFPPAFNYLSGHSSYVSFIGLQHYSSAIAVMLERGKSFSAFPVNSNLSWRTCRSFGSPAAPMVSFLLTAVLLQTTLSPKAHPAECPTALAILGEFLYAHRYAWVGRLCLLDSFPVERSGAIDTKGPQHRFCFQTISPSTSLLLYTWSLRLLRKLLHATQKSFKYV